VLLVPTVTALREDRRGRVAVELDGESWRTLPLEVVARAGLAEGKTLAREDLRLLRRELRRAEALALAGRALRTRDLSGHQLTDRLSRRAISPAAREEALDVLARAGVLDDARLARNRAGALAERGYGDAAIRHDLEGRGIGGDELDAAVADLEPELDRARRLVERRGPGARTARFLAGKGFGEEALDAAAGLNFANDP
jgi:SOS response regulatory protein OraA/RecX